ncbi:MAG: helix-turn-helix transcriptional regulator [Nanoarchaeota archaeon]
MALNEQFKTERIKRGLSQCLFARALNTNQAYISMMESGKKPITESEFVDILKKLTEYDERIKNPVTIAPVVEKKEIVIEKVEKPDIVVPISENVEIVYHQRTIEEMIKEYKDKGYTNLQIMCIVNSSRWIKKANEFRKLLGIDTIGVDEAVEVEDKEEVNEIIEEDVFNESIVEENNNEIEETEEIV